MGQQVNAGDLECQAALPLIFAILQITVLDREWWGATFADTSQNLVGYSVALSERR
jgi:hypothetical protein